MSGLEIIPASEADRATIVNLIQLYLYDMTDEGVWPIGDDGRYEYGLLDRFWRYPYLVRIDGALAGLALVIDECPLTGERPCWFMAEFFVMRGYRRRGVGREVIADLLRRHAGKWHVAVMTSHPRAEAFWAEALRGQEVDMRSLSSEGEEWRLRSFVTESH
jgi:predicted acetyltransferase